MCVYAHSNELLHLQMKSYLLCCRVATLHFCYRLVTGS